MPIRTLLVALALIVSGCGSDDAPAVPEAEVAPAQAAATPDVTGRADPTETETPASDLGTEIDNAVVPVPSPEPVPAAGPPDGREPLPAVLPDQLAVVNDTGMRLIYLHIAGCTESEGNDWADMPSWATDYLGAETVEAGDTVFLDLQPGCYVMRSEWDSGASMQERVETTAGMTHHLQLDV